MKSEGGGMATGNNFGEKLLPPLFVCVCVCVFPVCVNCDRQIVCEN